MNNYKDWLTKAIDDKELEKHLDIDDEIKVASRLTTYAIETRYPGDYCEINEDEYEEAIYIALTCLNWVENKIKIHDIQKNKIVNSPD